MQTALQRLARGDERRREDDAWDGSQLGGKGPLRWSEIGRRKSTAGFLEGRSLDRPNPRVHEGFKTKAQVT